MLSSFGKVNIDFSIRKTMPNRRGVFLLELFPRYIYIYVACAHSLYSKAVYLSVFEFSFAFLQASPFIKNVNLIK